MPTNKDLKRLVRSRMKKTGESYTAARAQVTKNKTSTKAKSASTAKAMSALKSDFEKLAGTSDAIMEARTGCGWEKWVYVLDKWGAIDKTHTEIATHVHKKYKIDGWWAQCVTVGYERIRGLRARGQRRDGRWEASKSKTYAVPVAELFDAWNTAKLRTKWLPEKITVSRATPHKSMRFKMPDGTSVELYFQAKGEKSIVGVQHTRLPSKADADQRKKFWSERLAALNELLAE